MEVGEKALSVPLYILSLHGFKFQSACIRRRPELARCILQQPTAYDTTGAAGNHPSDCLKRLAWKPKEEKEPYIFKILLEECGGVIIIANVRCYSSFDQTGIALFPP